MVRRIVAAFALLFATGYAGAQPGPQLLTVFPPGAKAGDTVDVTFAGAGFDGDEKLLFSAKGFTAERVGSATVDPKAAKGAPAAAVKFKVTAPKESGTFDVRVVSKSGLSNPRSFAVDALTNVNETEPNNDVPQAQKVELETTVNGTIAAPTDVDFVAFKAKAGQNVVVYCLTSSIDSRMQADLMVSSADGKALASNRGYHGGDAVLDFKAPADGEYVVRVSQFAYTTGGADHFYRLTVTTEEWVDALFPPLTSTMPKPFSRNGPAISIRGLGRFAASNELHSNRLLAPTAAMIDAVDAPGWMSGGNLVLTGRADLIEDNEKNGTADAAQAVKIPCDVAGRIAKKNERHWYKFDAKKGDVWTLEVFAERIGSPVDAYFVLTDNKGKAITEQDDAPDTLSPNQFYTKGDDPARYRFAVPADGTYKVMVSTREAGVQFGVRDQYVLRIAKEKPDFRVAVMPLSTHIPDGATLAKGGSAVFAVFAFRFDGFDGAIELGAAELPKGVTCPKQFIGPGQTRGTLVLTADKDARDWDGFVTITAKSGAANADETPYHVRPFTVTWPAVNVQPNQVPNTPMITRMDRGGGLALAVRGDAPRSRRPETALTAKPGSKVDVTLKVVRKDTFKDGITILAATPNFGPRPQGNQPFPPLGTAAAGGTELKLSVDVPAGLPPGTHTLVLRGQSAASPPKVANNAAPRPVPTYAAVPITVTIEGAEEEIARRHKAKAEGVAKK